MQKQLFVNSYHGVVIQINKKGHDSFFEIFATELRTTLVKVTKVQCKYANGKPI